MRTLLSALQVTAPPHHHILCLPAGTAAAEEAAEQPGEHARVEAGAGAAFNFSELLLGSASAVTVQASSDVVLWCVPKVKLARPFGSNRTAVASWAPVLGL